MRFSSSNGRGNSFSRGRKGRGANQARRALKSRRVEQLEPRQMLTVTMNPINNVQLPGGQVTYVPLTGIDSSNGPITYTLNTTDPNVHLSLQSTTSKTLVLNVSGTDNTGTAFTGTLELHLFEDLAPITTARIESLVTSGFFTGKDFFRVLDGFVAQNNGSSGIMSSIPPEGTAEIPFTSPGLLSLANTGQSNGFLGDAQFFITAIDKAGSTTPIPLAEMPQGLQNGSSQQFTVFGQLVSGFDTFEKIMSTTVQAQSDPNFGGEVSSPTQPITITSASLISDTQNAVLKITAPASFDGNSAIITVTATGSGGATTQKVFTTSVVVDPPQIAPVANQTTTATTPVTFTLQSGLNDQNSGAVYRIFDANTLTDPTNATVSINQSTGQVTITPKPGFKGTLNLLAGVKSGSVGDVPVNYDTQAFTLTVTANPAIKPTLGTVGNQTTAVGAGDSFTLTSTDNGANGVAYKVADATTFSTPTNATVSVTPAGVVTITPNAGFVGTINLVAGVRSQTDPDTQASYATQTFTLTVLAPVLSPIGSQTIAEGAEDDFTLSATDPVGHGLVYKIVDATTHQPPANVTVSVDSQGNVTMTPDAGFTGSRNLLAEVRSNDTPDVQANYVTQAFTLSVVAPTLDPVSAKGSLAGVAISFNLSGHDTALGNGLFYQVTGDQTNVDIVVDSSTGEVTLTPHAGFSGTINLTAGVRDATSPDVPENYVTQDFTFSVVALDQVGPQTTVLGTPFDLDLTTTPANQGGFVFKIYDGNSFNDPANVTWIDNGDGHITITPNPGFTGTTSLRAAIRSADAVDDPANYDTVEFDLTVNPGPTVDDIGNQTTTRGTPIAIPVTLGNVPTEGVSYALFDSTGTNKITDATVEPGNAPNTIKITPNAGFIGTINDVLLGVRDQNAVDDPANYNLTPDTFDITVDDSPTMDPVVAPPTFEGTPIVDLQLSASGVNGDGAFFKFFNLPAGMAEPVIDQATGKVTITPPPGFTGTLTLTVGVRGGNAVDDPANYSTQDFDVTVNPGPVLSPVGDISVPLNAPSISLSLNASDPAGHGLIFDVVDAATLAPPANVTVSVNGNQVTLTPTAAFSGTMSLLARVRGADADDDPLNYSTDAFNLTVVAPTLPPVANQTTAEGRPESFNLNATDPIGHGLVYKIVDVTPGSPTAHYTTSVDSSGKLTITPDAGFTGTRNLVVEVRLSDSPEDPASYVTQAFTLNVVGLNVVANQTTGEGAPITITLTPSQSGGDVAYNIFDGSTFTAPAHLTIVSINNATGQVVLKPDAGFTGPISLRAGVRGTSANPAAQGSYDLQSFTLTVVAPVLGAVTNQTVAVGATNTFTLTGTDNSGQGLTYKIVDATTMQPAAHLTATVDSNENVTIVPDAGFTGALNLLAEVRSTPSDDVQSNYVTQPFSLTIVAPTLDTVANQTTDSNTAKTVQLAGHNTLSNPLFYKNFTTGVTNVTVTVNSSTGAVTLTPTAGTTGTFTIKVGVRDSTSPDVEANYAEQSFTLTVTAPPIPNVPTGLAVDSSSNTGPFDGNGYVTTNTPKLTVTAQTGSTVQFKLNGTVIATGTETAAGSGIFTATIPAGKLAIGSNTITATAGGTGGTSADSTALTVIYAPDFTTGVYVVPGAPGSSQQVTIGVPHVNAAYKDEIGYFIADSADGSIGGVAPGSAGYAQAALSSSTRHIVFAHGKKAGTSDTVTLSGGQFLVFYMIQNDTTADFLAKNPSDAKGKGPVAFFSVTGANPDAMKHTQIVADPTTGRVEYNWEDLMSQGDKDFNDAVMTVRLATQSSNPPATLHAPGTGSTSVTLTGTLGGGHQSTAPGDIGVFFTDDPDGTIGTLKPGDSGYAAAALAANNFQVLFAAGTAAGTTQSITVPAGQYLGFYVISSGTTDDFNSSTSGASAMFSFNAANSNGLSHFRWYTPGQQKTDPSQMQLHIMDHVFGHENAFDDLTADLSFVAGSGD